ncbi:unnamed protein product [Pieris brassicae]|uniref:Uncharacterized protein n=1 Tax=Pieris brassicae TaxID=7116 RepID=A0A9P0TU73_PIEBR|nr:unnamed protein product [Pieris brassicae]
MYIYITAFIKKTSPVLKKNRHAERQAQLEDGSTAGERAADARRPSGGNRQSHPVVGGIALTPRYSPRPRLDNIRPAAAPPEEPSEPLETPYGLSNNASVPVSTTLAGPA